MLQNVFSQLGYPANIRKLCPIHSYPCTEHVGQANDAMDEVPGVVLDRGCCFALNCLNGKITENGYVVIT